MKYDKREGHIELSEVERAIMFPIVIVVMAIMDYVAWQVISALNTPNAFWYLAALALGNVAVVFGMIKQAAGYD